MKNIELVIKMPESIWVSIQNGEYCGILDDRTYNAIKNGTPLPAGHGRIVDVGKIDEDRIDHDNPIIYLTMNGEYVEAVSLDYINNLPTIIEADKVGSEDSE